MAASTVEDMPFPHPCMQGLTLWRIGILNGVPIVPSYDATSR